MKAWFRPDDQGIVRVNMPGYSPAPGERPPEKERD